MRRRCRPGRYRVNQYRPRRPPRHCGQRDFVQPRQLIANGSEYRHARRYAADARSDEVDALSPVIVSGDKSAHRQIDRGHAGLDGRPARRRQARLEGKQIDITPWHPIAPCTDLRRVEAEGKSPQHRSSGDCGAGAYTANFVGRPPRRARCPASQFARGRHHTLPDHRRLRHRGRAVKHHGACGSQCRIGRF
ncbi:Uncharacterised protein [Serratia marcescens]|nr:Uncharacterised protein [Serratia marcescens]